LCSVVQFNNINSVQLHYKQLYFIYIVNMFVIFLKTEEGHSKKFHDYKPKILNLSSDFKLNSVDIILFLSLLIYDALLYFVHDK